MSPEQWQQGVKADRQSDIWSVGVLLHRCVSGKLPFGEGENHWTKIMMSVLNCEASPPCLIHDYDENLGVEIDPRLAYVVNRALDKEKCRRYKDAGHMLQELQVVYQDIEVWACRFIIHTAR